MAYIDVFNGDADGICALQQLRLAEPRAATLVTGVKRDIALLGRVDAAAGDRISVLDLSLDQNRPALLTLLHRGAQVAYFDHHYPGEVPAHDGLDAHIDTQPDKGTSLIVDEYLGGSHRAWAVVGTFGDNFDAAALRAAAALGLTAEQIAVLRELGIYLNYNGYGARIEDLHFPPDDLYRRLAPYADPLAFVAGDETFKALKEGYAQDMTKALALRPEIETETHGLYVLPDEPWARRVSGVLANHLAQAAPERAHALLSRLAGGGLLVSVRAPMSRPVGADDLCRQFPTGGGRKAAAGINELPDAAYDRFVEYFLAAFRGTQGKAPPAVGEGRSKS
jgi:single-stranded DNA-specific DHH superfamily exonuclease